MAKKAKKSVKNRMSAKPVKPVKKGAGVQKKTKKTEKKPGKVSKVSKIAEKKPAKVKILKAKVEKKVVAKALKVEKKAVIMDKKAVKIVQKAVKTEKKGMAATKVIEAPAVAVAPVKVKRAGRQPSVKVKKIRKVFTPFNPIQPASASGKPVNTTKKEPKGRFELEYVIRCSEPLLYDFISTPSGLSEWFSDNVNIRDGIYTFYWDGSEQKARLLALKEEEFIRYQWMDKTDGSYFEFKIVTDDLTGDVSLIIIDFADGEDDQLSARLLWDAQVDKLKKTIGSHT